MQKKCEKPFYNDIKVVVYKRPLQKAPNIREMRQKICIIAKAIANAKAIPLAKSSAWVKN